MGVEFVFRKKMRLYPRVCGSSSNDRVAVAVAGVRSVERDRASVGGSWPDLDSHRGFRATADRAHSHSHSHSDDQIMSAVRRIPRGWMKTHHRRCPCCPIEKRVGAIPTRIAKDRFVVRFLHRWLLRTGGGRGRCHCSPLPRVVPFPRRSGFGFCFRCRRFRLAAVGKKKTADGAGGTTKLLLPWPKCSCFCRRFLRRTPPTTSLALALAIALSVFVPFLVRWRP
mmetsp:Transcript_30271/g.71329  ORF Transcript_30271/g.71329 Transcript_30271/m.71329 type:complete len:225 (-) Transcript_30271:425-1099(-)